MLDEMYSCARLQQCTSSYQSFFRFLLKIAPLRLEANTSIKHDKKLDSSLCVYVNYSTSKAKSQTERVWLRFETITLPARNKENNDSKEILDQLGVGRLKLASEM